MTSATFYAYPGYGERARKVYGYSQAVRMGDRVEVCGQGGWYPDDEDAAISDNLEQEISQAFRNLDLALKHAGTKGFSQVVRIHSYHVNLRPEVIPIMTENFRKWMPDHQPLWTMLGVEKLGLPGMNVEIEVVAYDPKET